MRKILYLLPVAAFFVSCVADSIQEELSTSQGQHGVCLFDASISEREGTRVVGEWGTDGILAEWESSDRIGVFAGDETQAAVFTVKELDGTNAVFEGETIADAASYLAFYPYSELLGREGTSLSGKMNFLQRYSSPGYAPPQPLREIPISNRSFCKATTARCSPAKASGLRSPRRTMRR